MTSKEDIEPAVDAEGQGDGMEMVMDVADDALQVRAENAEDAGAGQDSLMERMEAAVEALEGLVKRLGEKAIAASVPVTGTFCGGRKTVVGLAGRSEETGLRGESLDAALVSLPVEQRIAVKAELLRAGLV